MTKKQIECSECDYIHWFEDSTGLAIAICVNAESGAYLEETGICGNCELEVKE